MTCEVEIFLFRTNSPPDKGTIHKILDSMGQDRISIIVDRDVVFSRSHISSAIMHATRSILNGKARARVGSIEVIRWLTGSHQVSRGIEIANPGKATTHILVMRLPKDWPNINCRNALPDLVEKGFDDPAPADLETATPPFEFGGDLALRKIGIDYGNVSTYEEKEKIVLETVCLPGLK